MMNVAQPVVYNLHRLHIEVFGESGRVNRTNVEGIRNGMCGRKQSSLFL